MAITQKKKEFERRLQKVESLIKELETLEEGQARRSAVEAIQALLELHGETLDRMLELIAARGEAGEAIIHEIAADEMVGGLLLLHGLHPLSLEDRVRGALTKVRPYLGSHGGNVELLDITDGVARLRLQGTCESCASSTLTIKYAIEREIAQAAPDLVDLVVEGVTPPPVPAGFIPLTQIKPVAKKAETNGSDAWQTVSGLAGLASGQVRVEAVGEVRILFCRLGQAMYAYQEKCPACGRSLDGSTLDGTVLRCVACARRYDVHHAGREMDGGPFALSPIPLLEEAGQLKLAVAAMAG